MRALVETQQLERRLADTQDPTRDEACVLREEAVLTAFVSADVAEAIAFLCDSQRCSFINGVSLPVDGGWTADGSWDSLRLRTRSKLSP